MSSKRSYSNRTLGLLWGNSGNICAFPGCNQILTKQKTANDNSIVVGEIAHIVAVGEKYPITPRPDRNFPREDLNKYENLILLCPTHHTIVDKQPNTYSVDDLIKWKSFREDEHLRGIYEGYQNLGFVELEQILKAIPLAEQGASDPDFNLLGIREKIKKNQLSPQAEKLLKFGYQSLNQVDSYIEGLASVDTSYPERLKSGFINLYKEIVNTKLQGDALLLALKERIVSNRTDTLLQAAALSVILYYFEKCEIFEK
jgi:hypothetical protein